MTYKLGGVPTQKAIWFDGVADKAYYTPGSTGIANLSPQPNEAWSIFLWGKNCSTSAHKVFCGQRNTSSPYEGWDFGVNPTSTTGALYVNIHSDVSGLRTLSADSGVGFSTALNTVGWYHVGFTYDGTGTASGCKIYCNGQLVTTTNALSSGTAGEFAGGSMAAVPLALADLESGATWAYQQAFTACQFVVCSGALSATQVQDIYSGNGDRPGPCDLRNKLGGAAGITLRGYWLYGNDSDSASTLQDGTANNFDLTGSSLNAGQLLPVNI